MYRKIIKAINEGLNRALMNFNDEEKFDKETQLKNKTANNIVTQEYMKQMTGEAYEKILKLYHVDGILFPVETKADLKNIINKYTDIIGPDCDLNWIDVSNITDMSYIFNRSQFNGDISKWDVSNVVNMEYMFAGSKFNGDISEWDISNVINMTGMFAFSVFNRDISKWDVSNVKYMNFMFVYSKFNWDISDWDVNNVCFFNKMFNGCPIKEEYKPNFIY